MISIHALLAESDPQVPGQVDMDGVISIHALLAESDLWWDGAALADRNFYPRSPCGERRCCHVRRGHVRVISIHALLAESDPQVPGQVDMDGVISIHALLAESDLWWDGAALADRNFYPRSPCGERRCATCRLCQCCRDFYPRSPCGERRGRVTRLHHLFQFLSTLSLRRATPMQHVFSFTIAISIHALLAESDSILFL